MRDWREDVRRKLADSKLSAAEREEISRELAGYLEDFCADAASRGFDDSAAGQVVAIQNAAAELHEDKHLGAHLYRARKENIMNDRTKRFWLPGTITLLASALALVIFQIAGLSPYFPSAWAGNASAEPFLYHSLTIYLPWLCVLPFLGAAGAYWSRRAGSGPGLRIAVGLFPAIVFMATFVVWVSVAAAIGSLPPANIFAPALTGHILSWVVIPALALLAGVAPFLRSSADRQRSA